MDVSIIILTFNARDVTLRMLDSLKNALNHAVFQYEVIVIDNGSTDGIAGDLVLISQNENWFKFIQSTNTGFANGNNRAYNQSDKSAKYVLFLNPDIILEEDTLNKMYEYMESHSDVALSTCRVDIWSGGLDWDCHRGFPTPWRAFCYFTGLEKYFGTVLPKIFGGYHLLDKDLSKEHEIDVCLGAFMFVRSEFGNKIGWWPEDYFLNGEDVDFCYQIKVLKHGKIMYVPHAKITHYKGASKGTKKQSSGITKATSGTKTLQINSGIKSMEIFYRKYYDEQYPWILNQLIYVGIWILHKKRLILGKE